LLLSGFNLAKVNPFSRGVDAVRALSAGDFQDVEIFEGFAIISAPAVVVFLLALRQLRERHHD
jgi:hypothetical protein